jgi:hypothetical protein
MSRGATPRGHVRPAGRRPSSQLLEMPRRVLASAEVVHPRSPPSEQEEVGREYLQVLGLQSRTIDAWLREGVLRRTGAEM